MITLLLIFLIIVFTAAPVIYIHKKKTASIENKENCQGKAACDCSKEEKSIDYNKQIKENLLKEEQPNYLYDNIFFGTYDKPEYPYIQVL